MGTAMVGTNASIPRPDPGRCATQFGARAAICALGLAAPPNLHRPRGLRGVALAAAAMAKAMVAGPVDGAA